MNNQKKRMELGKAVRRALVASAVLAPAPFISHAAYAQVADAGADSTVRDSDGLPGESVTLDGRASQPSSVEARITSYVWTNAQGVQIATGDNPVVRLPDGVNQIRLTITEDDGTSSSSESTRTAVDFVTITVQPSAAPIANAGPDRTIADSDNQPGEVVALDGSTSSDADGTITSYEWFRDGNTPLGRTTSPRLENVSLPDGANQITLVVTDDVGNTATDTAVITVGAAPPVESQRLAELDLKPNERQVAQNLDGLCPRLAALDSEEGSALTEDQRDLLQRCSGINGDESAQNQIEALEELSAQDINAMRTQALIFSRTQHQGVMDRLIALRAGERGVSFAGLSLRIGEKFVSGEQIAESLAHVLGGGASADEAGGLFDNRLGLWLRGNYGNGDKQETAADNGFESSQWGFTGGVDYRFSNSTVAGVSLGYGGSDVDFNPTGQGDMKTKALTGSLYGSTYLGNFYFDGVMNYARSDYDSNRRILYTEAGTRIDREARGSTSGKSLSGGIAAGYDFVAGAFTISPTLEYFYADTDIDGFAESGAAGLNLAYNEQNYESATGSAGLRISYAWKMPWGVLIPHFRGALVREFEDATEVFSVRFASDPFASSSDPTPPIIVVTDEPDDSYYRVAVGVSAQFAYDISGYVDYQRLESYSAVDFQEFTIGLRIQHSFR